jgi:hypothetical protein
MEPVSANADLVISSSFDLSPRLKAESMAVVVIKLKALLKADCHFLFKYSK